MFAGFKNKIEKLIEKGINTFYIYPFGNRGLQIYNHMNEWFNDIHIICVDDNLFEDSKQIISYNEMKKVFNKAENDKKNMVLLSSDNPMIYQELRSRVAMDFDDGQVVDLFEWNPFCFDRDNRISALAMAGKQIYENHVEGAVAEAGVYKGEFAKYINRIFPDRNLYLFDTFEGFVEGQVNDKRDNLNQTNSWIDTLKDSAVEEVLKKMPYKNMVKIYKGVFPDTAYGIKEKFAFVNLDMDLYYPIYEGLIVFWEYLAPGGIIFIHDYGNWDGATAAVKEFCKGKQIGYIWSNDRATAIISKALDEKS